ncbi:MAG: hypothetical protein VYD87_13385 [Pseudomonadota bacterium]|nr:hypothetical protein [Pseudomonadota bacterium]MEE3101361.1 hypothetical protein [Pseudomonadota bacterium]
MVRNLKNPGAEGPSAIFAPIAPNDGADLPGGQPRGIFVGTGGALTLRGADGADVVIQSADHQYHPLRPTRVLATGTTADDIVALY